jgi:hypothetical protein
VCHSISGFTTCFPEKSSEFKGVIKTLIEVIGNKTGAIRKSAAVLLANLAKDEENGKEMRLHHGSEVLMSLRD